MALSLEPNVEFTSNQAVNLIFSVVCEFKNVPKIGKSPKLKILTFR